MKTGWTAKEEREYSQLRDEFTAAGDSEKQARLRAAQIVNANRTHDGDTDAPEDEELRGKVTTTDRITAHRMPQPGDRRMHTPDTIHAGGVHGHGHRAGGH